MQNNIRALRRERLWSQNDLAELVGVSRTWINAIEKERFNPSLQLAYDIAEVLQRSVLEVFPPDGPFPLPDGRDKAFLWAEMRGELL